MALANALCGNAPGAAALEFAGPAGSFTASRPLRFAVAGGECDIRIDDRIVQAGESHRLRPGEVLRVGVARDVTWAYLAFSGGIATAPVLGSRAPQTTRRSRAWIIAPAHIAQGSSVT